MCVFFLCSHRLKESSTLPDIAEDLKSIKSALGIAADGRIDFILIRDDLVAREVMLPHRAEFPSPVLSNTNMCL